LETVCPDFPQWKPGSAGSAPFLPSIEGDGRVPRIGDDLADFEQDENPILSDLGVALNGLDLAE